MCVSYKISYWKYRFIQVSYLQYYNNLFKMCVRNNVLNNSSNIHFLIFYFHFHSHNMYNFIYGYITWACVCDIYIMSAVRTRLCQRCFVHPWFSHTLVPIKGTACLELSNNFKKLFYVFNILTFLGCSFFKGTASWDSVKSGRGGGRK